MENNGAINKNNVDAEMNSGSSTPIPDEIAAFKSIQESTAAVNSSYTSILKRLKRKGNIYKKLDRLQFDIEDILSSTEMRSRKLEQVRDEETRVSEASHGFSAMNKRKKLNKIPCSTEENTRKKTKIDFAEAGPSSTSQSSNGKRSRAMKKELTGAELEDIITEKNVRPSRYTKYFNPYFRPINRRDLKALENMVASYDDDSEEGNMKCGEEIINSEANSSPRVGRITERLVLGLVSGNTRPNASATISINPENYEAENTDLESEKENLLISVNAGEEEKVEENLRMELIELGIFTENDYEMENEKDAYLKELKIHREQYKKIRKENLQKLVKLYCLANDEMQRQMNKERLTEVEAKIVSTQENLRFAKKQGLCTADLKRKALDYLKERVELLKQLNLE